MFFEALESVSPAQMRALAARGVPQPRVSDWRRGIRFPTRVQALDFAEVMGIDFGKLEYELATLERAAGTRKKSVERAMGIEPTS